MRAVSEQLKDSAGTFNGPAKYMFSVMEAAHEKMQRCKTTNSSSGTFRNRRSNIIITELLEK